MGACPNPPARYRFDRFELRPAERTLHRDGAPVKLGGRAFDMLVALVERHERVVTKRELMDLVWPKLVVEENNLQAQVVALRKLLGPAAITTVPGRGYRITLAIATVGAEPPAGEPAPAKTPPRTNLLRSVDALIGRERELAQLRDLVAEHRLVTVTGPGGVGKSRLVTDVAWSCVDAFPDGVWLVELAAVSDASLVPSAVTATLGVEVAPGTEPAAALARGIGERRMLLVLDNCEHVVDAVAALLDRVLAAAPPMPTRS